MTQKIPAKAPKLAKGKVALNQSEQMEQSFEKTRQLISKGKPTGLTMVGGTSPRSTRTAAKPKTGRY